MKRTICGIILVLIFSLPAVGSNISSLVVSGDSTLVLSNLIDDPPSATLSTLGAGDTIIPIVPEEVGTSTGLSLVMLNASGVAWEGLSFELEGGAFTDLPMLSFGAALDASVSGPGDTLAQLISPVPVGGAIFHKLAFTLDSTQLELTITPLVPEPMVGLTLVGALLLRRNRVVG